MDKLRATMNKNIGTRCLATRVATQEAEFTRAEWADTHMGGHSIHPSQPQLQPAHLRQLLVELRRLGPGKDLLPVRQPHRHLVVAAHQQALPELHLCRTRQASRQVRGDMSREKLDYS